MMTFWVDAKGTNMVVRQAGRRKRKKQADLK
jgi:hypothetical protein